MAGKDIEAALMAVEPETKAAKIRQVMPVIERQLKAGVTRRAILEVLKQQGIEVSMDTLKSYLYRHRKAQKEGTPSGQPPVGHVEHSPAPVAQPTEAPATEIKGGVSYDTDKQQDQPMPHLGPAELAKLMNPGDDQNAQDLDKYEQAARNTRNRK
ncbi:TPA: hypothetical protein ACUUEN_005503 [Pseudomonas aeruginosa]